MMTRMLALALCLGCIATAHAQAPNGANQVTRIGLQVYGPATKAPGGKAHYTITVVSSGNVSAHDVVLTHSVPAGFRFIAADQGGRFDAASRTVTWRWNQLSAGSQTPVLVELEAANAGEWLHTFRLSAGHGLTTRAQLRTRVESTPALLLMVTDTEEPIAPGADNTFEIRVTNVGPRNESNVVVRALIPAGMEFRNATGPTSFHRRGNEVIFEPLATLNPRADAIYHVVTVKTTSDRVRSRDFKVRVEATNVPELRGDAGPSNRYDP